MAITGKDWLEEYKKKNPGNYISSENTKSTSITGAQLLEEYNKNKQGQSTTTESNKNKQGQSTTTESSVEKGGWFQKSSLFDDGYQFGDVFKTGVGTTTDLVTNLTAGLLGMGESAVDAVASLIPGTSEFVKKDLYDEEAIMKSIFSDSVKALTGIDSETDSVLGQKMDNLGQSAGQLAGTIGLQAVGVPWWVTTGATAFGSETENAFNQGATQGEAVFSGLVSAAGEILSEKLSGGISFGGKTLDDVTVKPLLSKISNRTVRKLANLGFDMAGEGAEEILSGVISAVGQKLSYASEAEISELFSSEDALDSFIGGAILSFGGSVVRRGVQVPSNIRAKQTYGDNQSIQDLLIESANIGGEAANVADWYTDKYGKKGKLSGADINDIINTRERELITQDKANIKMDSEAKLIEHDETGDVSAIADVLVKQATGEKLKSKDLNILNKSKAGHLVSTQMNPDNIKSGVLHDDWATYMGTSRIRPDVYNREGYALGKAIADASKHASLMDDDEAEESQIKVSDNGKNMYYDAEAKDYVDADIKSIISTKGGIKVELENGKTVSASDLAYASREEGVVYEMLARMGVTPETANEIINTFKPSNEKQADLYFDSIPLAYRMGLMGNEQGLKYVNLTDAQKRLLYNRGRIDAVTNAKERDNARATSSKKTAAKVSTEKGIIFENGFVYDETSASDLQRKGMAGAEAIAKTTNLEVHVFDSKLESDANGYFKDGNKIYINLSAGMNAEGAMLYALSHEVTHYIRKWNAQGFKDLADFLIEQYGKKGVNINALIQRQKDKIKKRYSKEGKALPNDAKLFDMAYEEMVADAMSDMLADTKAYEKLAELKKKNFKLWQKLGEIIKKVLDKLKNALNIYRKDSPVAVEALLVRDFSQEVYDKLQDLYIKAFVEADANYASAEQTLAESGIAVNPDTDSASLLSVRDVLTDEQKKKVSSALATRFGVTQEEAMDWLKAETSMASLILNPKYSQYLDYTPDPNEVAIKQNSDYPQGTVDFSPICAKRREFTSVMNNILRLFPNHVFAATDLAKIRTIMQEEGMTIPCGICYVEDRRQLDTIVAQNFIDSLKLYREGSKTRPDGNPFNANQLKGLSLIDGDSYTPSVYELVSLEGLNLLKEKNPNMAEAWVKFNNARGMQSVRLLANEAEYKRQILKYDKRTVKSKNDKGGLRVYSFSDAEMFHLIDIIQVITDSATVGLYLQGYTKVNEYARAVKDTGEKLNRSLIPKGELGYHIEDGKVVLDYDTVEGIDINHPDFFDNRDNPNVGNITIGVSDVQIRAAMVSDFVDQIIPFHTGQSEEVLGEKGIATWSNYKDFQGEKDIATGTKSEHQINIYTEVLQELEKEGKPITKRTFVEKFLQVCKDNGLTPRFSQFLNTNENGEYVYTEGYHKMLVDFKTFAQTEVGEYLPQMPVKPIFDNEYITKVMKDYVKSQKVKDAELTKSMPKVIERITNEIVKPSEVDQSSEVKYSEDRQVLFSVREEYVSEIDEWSRDAMPDGETFVLGTTGDILQGLGAIENDIYLQGDKIKEILSAHPEITLDEIKKIPQILENPILILKSRNVGRNNSQNTRLVIFGSVKAKNGLPILSVMDLRPTENHIVIDDMQKVTSAYTKTNNPVEFIRNSEVLYAEKKKTTSLLRTIGFQMPIELNKSGFVGSISYSGQNVNISGEKYSDVFLEGSSDGDGMHSDRDSEGNTLSKEQQEFFKDSKVRDKKGNIKVLYHGTTASFNTFKKGDVGFHFGTKGAARGRVGFGKNVTLKEVYLNITNPIVFDEDLGSWDADYELTKKLYSMDILTRAEAESVLFTDNKLYRRSSEEANKKLSALLQSKGYDGIAYTNTHEGKKDSTSYIVFNSNQAKEITNKTPTSDPDIRYSDRDTDAVSNRTLLANALESTAQNDIEKNKLEQYKQKIAFIESEQAKLDKNREEAKELRFKKGRIPSETKRLHELDAEATQLANRISIYDKQLLNLESTTALKNVLEREKTILRKRLEKQGKEALQAQRAKNSETVREIMTRNTESRHKAVEGRHKTEMRRDIKKLLQRLNKLFKGGKERNVKEGMKEAVSTALALGDVLFNNEISNLDIVNLGVESVTEKESKHLDEYRDLLMKKESNLDRIRTLRAGVDVDNKEQTYAYISELEAQNRKYDRRMSELNGLLSDVFVRERARLNRMPVNTLIDELASEYHELQSSEYEYIKNAYNPELFDKLISLKKNLGGVVARDMSLYQLEQVKKVFTMLEHSIRTANQEFRNGKWEDLQQSASAVMEEIETLRDIKQEGASATSKIRSFLWNELTPYYAFDKIGSKTLMAYFKDLMRGQAVAARDSAESKAFAQATREKYNYSKWKLDEIHEFQLSDGSTFRTTLKHLLSVYAYSKRKQAELHMSVGGFFHNDKATFRKEKGVLKMVKTDAKGYKVDANVLAQIKTALGNEKMSYVDEMLDYLTKMGEKGNEVTRVMWGVDIFTEKVYFPLKSKEDFLKKSTETAQAVSLKNDGMTKETVPGASNPIVLEAFDDVWANHVERMSVYHGFVIPIDNLNKVLHYGTWVGTDAMSVSTMLEGKFTSAATDYLEQFIKDLNGGAVVQGATNPFMSFFAKFKKTAVGASLSTVVQQPTAIIRAMAEIDAKYFVGKPHLTKLSERLKELKTYAPIAIIKEIGGFDAGGSKSIARWINSDTLTGIDKVMNTIDDVSMKGAEYADWIGWLTIWEAVKRETKATTDLEFDSKEFLDKCGERFEEIIMKTQVYDSTLSRSGFMRSKNDGVKMLTSFMGEPTLSINMLYSAVLNALRGGKEAKLKAAKTIGYVYLAMILAEALSSAIYALRDDDEDESYMEKYLQSLGSGVISDVVLAPVTSLPGVKDIVSIFQGWDVERSDMAIFKDIKDAFDGLDSESKSSYRKVEDFAGAIAAAFGLPVKNVLRTGREIYNAGSHVFDDVSGGSAWDAFAEGVTGEKSTTTSENLYKAIIKGDHSRIESYKKGYKNEAAYETAVRNALRANDSRIKEAAQARYDGDIARYARIARAIISEGRFSQDIVVGAINAEMNTIKRGETIESEPTEDKNEVTSIYSGSDVNSAFDNGDSQLAQQIIADLIETKVANGMEERDAKSSLRSSMTSYWKPLFKQAYKSGNNSEMARIRRILYASGLYGTSNDVVKTTQNWLKS